MSAPATYLDNSIILYIIIMILNILNIYYRKTSYAQVGPFHSETLLSRLSPLSIAPVPAAGLWMASALDVWWEDMVQG